MKRKQVLKEQEREEKEKLERADEMMNKEDREEKFGVFFLYLSCDVSYDGGVREHHLTHSSLQVSHLRKLKLKKVSKEAWNRKWKGNSFGVRSGNGSQIPVSPAV